MSTKKIAETSHVRCVKDIRLSVVAERREREDLADYVRRVRSEKRLSLKDVEGLSGGGISKGYVGHIENRHVLGSAVTPQKLSSLAKGLGVPEDEVFDVARGKTRVTEADLSDDEEIAALFFEYKEMSDEDKQELRAVMEMVRQEIRRRKQAGELVSQRKARAKASKRR